MNCAAPCYRDLLPFVRSLVRFSGDFFVRRSPLGFVFSVSALGFALAIGALFAVFFVGVLALADRGFFTGPLLMAAAGRAVAFAGACPAGAFDRTRDARRGGPTVFP